MFLTIIFAVFLSDLACHILTKLHPNGSTDDKVMTSYRFFQRATIVLEIYPGCVIFFPTLVQGCREEGGAKSRICIFNA